MGWIRVLLRIGHGADGTVDGEPGRDSGSVGSVSNGNENFQSNRHGAHPDDELNFGFEEIFVTVALLILSYVVLSTPITRAGASSQWGLHLGNVGRSVRRNKITKLLQRWWFGENYDLIDDEEDNDTAINGNYNSRAFDHEKFQELLQKNVGISHEDYSSDRTIRARGGSKRASSNSPRRLIGGGAKGSADGLKSLFRPTGVQVGLYPSVSDGVLVDSFPESNGQPYERNNEDHQKYSKSSSRGEDSLPETDHDRFERAWKSHIRFSEYKRLVLPPECKLVDIAQLDKRKKVSSDERTWMQTTMALFEQIFNVLLKVSSIGGTKQVISSSIDGSKQFLLWLMRLFRVVIRRSRGLPFEDEEDDEDDDGSIATLDSGGKRWSFTRSKNSPPIPTTHKKLAVDAPNLANEKNENVENIPPLNNSPKVQKNPNENDGETNITQRNGKVGGDDAKHAADIDIISLSANTNHQSEQEDSLGSLSLRCKRAPTDANDDATFISANGLEHADSMDSCPGTAVNPLHYEFNVPTTVISRTRNSTSVSPIRIRHHQKDQSSHGTNKKKDALESYRKPKPPDPPLERISPMPSPKMKPQSQADEAHKMNFFDTADSSRQLQNLVREVPLPDANGYILGDEFLSSSSYAPLLVFVNSRSGPQQGELLISQFRRLLNPIQVWDLANGGPEKILKSFSALSRLQVLVCGGDGTVSWIISALEKMDLTRWPPIAILPLGTGNDLARVHGWGGGYNNESLLYILRQVSEAYVSLLDLWELDISDKKGKRKEVKSFMNYLGVGVDAQAALQVHMLRESKPKLFFSRFFNKAWYAIAGGEEALKSSCANLAQQITLVADGVEIPVPPESQGIIFLNIDSYSGGVPLWSKGQRPKRRRKRRHSEGDFTPINGTFQFPRNDSIEDLADYDGSKELSLEERVTKVTACDFPNSCQDGMLDVVSIRGTFHLGQIRVGLSNAQLLCQCREAVVTLKKKVAVQIDGEPWMQPRSTLSIVRKPNRATMLNRSADDNGGIEAEVPKLLTWASEKDIIDRTQYGLLMEEFSRRIEHKKRLQRERVSSFSIVA